jgi:hypothetical protein
LLVALAIAFGAQAVDLRLHPLQQLFRGLRRDACLQEGPYLPALPLELVAHALDLGAKEGKVGHASLVGGGWPANKNVRGTWSQGRMRLLARNRRAAGCKLIRSAARSRGHVGAYFPPKYTM